MRFFASHVVLIMVLATYGSLAQVAKLERVEPRAKILEEQFENIEARQPWGQEEHGAEHWGNGQGWGENGGGWKPPPKQPWHHHHHGHKPWHDKPLPTWSNSQPPKSSPTWSNSPPWSQPTWSNSPTWSQPPPSPTGKEPIGHHCKHHHHCHSGHCSKHRCCPKHRRGKKGDYCNMSDQCRTDHFCNHSKCDNKKGLGHKCYKNIGCESGNCVLGKCIADHSVKHGGKCTRSVQCIGDNFCNRTYCKKLQKKGGYCYKDNGCYSHSCKWGKCA